MAGHTSDSAILSQTIQGGGGNLGISPWIPHPTFNIYCITNTVTMVSQTGINTGGGVPHEFLSTPKLSMSTISLPTPIKCR